MPAVINIIIILFAIFALSRAILRFRERRISKLEIALWSLIWIAIIVVAIIPETSSEISKIVGVGRGVDFLVYLSIILVFYLIFRLYIKLDQAEQNITK